MANARLRMARQAGKRRRTSDAQPAEEPAAEPLGETSAATEPEPLKNECVTEWQGADAVHEAFRDRKQAMEARLHELTMGKALAKVPEPGLDVNGFRLKRTHRDFLLQEMEWMAADFAQERKWRLKSARVLALSVVSFHNKQTTRAARQQKQEEEAKRRLAARIGRDVKKFWTKIDKIISFKVKLQADELRKAAMDKHLKQLVAQTERYASALATTFQEGQEVVQHGDAEDDAEQIDADADRKTQLEMDTPSGEQQRIQDAQPVQDDTAAAASATAEEPLELGRGQRRLRGAQRTEPSLEQSGSATQSRADRKRPTGRGGESSDSDFAMNSEDEVDDEETIAIDEQHTTQAEVDEEIALLEEEGELSIEELRARYAEAMASEVGSGDGGDEEESSVESTVGSENEEFEPTADEMQVEDDETTIAAAEAGNFTSEDVDEEVRLLQEESELSIDELRARYADALSDNDEDASVSESEAPASVRENGAMGNDDDDDDDDEFQPTDEEPDDESTIEAAERNGGPTREEVNEELSLLRAEGELSIEELRARYANATEAQGDDESEISGDDGDETTSESAENPVSSVSAKDEGAVVGSQSKGDSDGVLTAPADRRSSLSSVSTPPTGFKRPYLLTSRLSLREYQEAGVNWLVSMCEKRINGILADEMGLGKTIQTISLLAHLACARGIWGPHLIVVPTSCLVNWEMEFKRWCPAFKVLTYFGSAKRRKELRQGWSKQNAFQICITSYQLVVQDAHCFKRKKWYYLILDEAHNIKNWKSLRWQTLLNFNSQRRLLLTGTPLQNNIMELWSLMHFLMPHVFSSRREFTYWFQNPLALMVEGSGGSGEAQDAASSTSNLVTQLHGIIRPFVLRRLKKDVAKQMPGKFEHVVVCKLSKRQRFLYEDFISRSSTRRAMFGSGRSGGGGANFMSMMNVLMQLRKVCNHPDLFEPRPIESPFDMPAIRLHAPSRCGFLMDTFVNEARDLPFWSHIQNLPNLEIAGYDKYTSSRWRKLYYYDVNALPLPRETSVSDDVREKYRDKKDILKRLVQLAEARTLYWQQKRAEVAERSRLRVELVGEPMCGSDLIRVCTLPVFISHAMDVHVKRRKSAGRQRARDWLNLSDAMSDMVKDPEQRVADMTPIVTRAVCYVPKARARPVEVIYGGSGFSSRSAVSKQEFVLSRKLRFEALEEETIKPVAKQCLDVYYDAFKRTQLFFPDKRLVQFDCGKLQQLDVLLRELKRGNHRCLIFTQMSSMLNILEIFLNIHGHTYFRLDGSTKVEKRQSLMDRFNRDEKIFCFILSTRSGGLGINLTGADSVIFYDSDWNPAMDAQAQDRAHRIGQTRDVHIYRLVSEHTVEENILKKAQQKRHLDFLVMAEGQFTTEFFSKANLRELVTGDEVLPESDRLALVDDEDEEEAEEPEMSFEALEDAMAQIEDEEDVVAMKGAKEEFMSEQREFEEEALNNGATSGGAAGVRGDARASSVAAKPSTPSSMSVHSSVSGKDDDEEDDAEDDDLESVDGSSTAEVADDSVSEAHTGELDEDASSAVDEANELPSEDDEDQSGSESENLMDDDEEEVAHAGNKRKRASSRASTKNTKNRRQRHGGGGDIAPTTSTTASSAKAEQQQRANDRAKEKAREKQLEMEEERKLQAWKDSVSSLKGFEDSLNPVDRYALHFREQIDPLYAYVPTAAAIESYFDSQHGKIDIEKIEEEKMAEEANLIADGELIAGIMDDTSSTAAGALGLPSADRHEDVEALHRALYKKERAHVQFERRRRLLTGVAWELKKCAITNQPFYFNVDTREATWDRPAIWAKNAQLQQTQHLGFAGLMPSVLLAVMKCLSPHPDRHCVQLVCKTWRNAASHPSLFVKLNANDLYARGLSLSQLLRGVAFGETVMFGSGVYLVDEMVEVKTPIKLLAAPDSHVELQMTTPTAQLRWTARGGMLCGFHLTRQSHADANDRDDSVPSTRTGNSGRAPPSSSALNWQHLLHVVDGGQVRVLYCDFDGSHQGNACVAITGSTSSRAILLHNRIYNGGSSGVLLLKGDLVMVLNSVYANAHSGVSVLMGNAMLRRNKIQKNGRFGIRLLYHAGNIIIEENIVNDHPCGNIDAENSGRRFVVRWNEMSKDEPDDLPHAHGKLVLKTFQIVEREIVKHRSSAEKKASKEAKALSPNPVAATAAVALVGASKLATSVGEAADRALSGASDDAKPAAQIEGSTGESLKVAPAVESSRVAGGNGEVVQATMATLPPDAEIPNSSGVTQTEIVELVKSSDGTAAGTSDDAKATTAAESAMKVDAEPQSEENGSVCAPITVATATTPSVRVGTAPVKPEAGAETTDQPVKKKRKRRPKFEKLLVDGRVIVFEDTCEKRFDKVKKPRQFKTARTEAGGAHGSDSRKSQSSDPATDVQGDTMLKRSEQSENHTTNSDSTEIAAIKASSAEDAVKVSIRAEERGVLQPVTAALLSASRPILSEVAASAEVAGVPAPPPQPDAVVVVKKKRGRKPKIKPAVDAGVEAAPPQ